MCEYCGCQALQSIDELTREHDAALKHVRNAERAAAADDVYMARQDERTSGCVTPKPPGPSACESGTKVLREVGEGL